MIQLGQHLPVFTIITPLFFAFLLSLANMLKPSAKAGIALAGALLHMLCITGVSILVYRSGTLIYHLGDYSPPYGITLVADQTTVLFLCILGSGHVLSTLYRMHTDKDFSSENRRSVLTSIFFCALSGMTFAGDLFNLFVFVELSSAATIGLITLKRKAAGTVAGFVYIMVASISSVLLLFAAVLIYVSTGHLSIAAAAEHIHLMPKELHAAAAACITVSFGIKFGMVPLHFWQPRAYHAAGSTTAGILSGFGMKIYLLVLLRLLFILLQAPRYLPVLFTILLAVSMITIVTGHLMAITDRDLKRLLAFSSVAHSGYILMAASAAGLLYTETPTNPAATIAMGAALFHCITHAAMKSSLLWAGRRLIMESSSSWIADLGGSGYRAPAHMSAFILSSLAIIGIPPTIGFASKWHIAAAQTTVLPIAVVGIGTILSLYYYARVITVAISQSARAAVPGLEAPAPRASKWSTDGIILLIIGLVLAGSGPAESLLMPLLSNAAETLLDPQLYIRSVFPGTVP